MGQERENINNMRKIIALISLFILMSSAMYAQKYTYTQTIGLNGFSMSIKNTGVDKYGVSYSTTDKYRSTGFNYGFELHQEGHKRILYLQTQFNDFENRYVLYDFKAGIAYHFVLVPGFNFYLTPALSVGSLNNEGRLGIYGGMGFALTPKKVSYRLELGTTVSSYVVAGLKLYVSF